MSGSSQTSPRFFNYPRPKPHDAPYKAPPPGKNPVVKGALLHYLSNLLVNSTFFCHQANSSRVATVPLVPGILWSNAGFSSLRECRQLDGIDPRYDPTVIPLPESDDAPLNYTDKSNFRASYPHTSSNRFYSIKDFHDAYSSGTLTPTDVVEHLLPLIRRDVAQRSPYSTAFMDSKVDMVRQAAEASTQRYKQGQPLGILDGVPFGVKDDLKVTGYKHYVGTTYDYSHGGNKETSWCAKMLEKEGAVLVGTLTMHEMGMGEWKRRFCVFMEDTDWSRYHKQQP